jgi:hypothetical protein
MLAFSNNDSKDQLTAEHANRSTEQERLSSNLVNDQYRWDSRYDIDDSDDACGQQRDRVVPQAERFEDDGGIVDDYPFVNELSR